MLQRLSHLVPPRVSAAVWKTVWNGWTTARRFQRVGPCLLGCGGRYGEDSIEHYARCEITRKVGRSFLGLQDTGYDKWLGNFITLGVNSGAVNDKDLTLRAVLVYATFRATNLLRHRQGDADHVIDMMQQFAKEAVRGHRKATRVLDSCFLQSSAHSSSSSSSSFSTSACSSSSSSPASST